MNYVTIPILRDFNKIERLFKIVSENNLGFIAGGFCRWMCSPKKEPSEARDVDVFTRGKEEFEKLKTILLMEEFLPIKSQNDISVVFKTSLNQVWKDCPQINLIKPVQKDKLLTFGSSMEEILENFDFSICRVGILNEKECLAHSSFLNDELKKEINILKLESPIAAIMRIFKYSGKGYSINIPQIMGILKEWDNRGDEYKNRLFRALEKFNTRRGWSNESDGEPHSIGQSLSKEENSIVEKSLSQEKDPFDNLLEPEDLDLYQLIRI